MADYFGFAIVVAVISLIVLIISTINHHVSRNYRYDFMTKAQWANTVRHSLFAFLLSPLWPVVVLFPAFLFFRHAFKVALTKEQR